MDALKLKTKRLLKRKARVRAKIFGTAAKPRLSVFRSNTHVYGQIINDEKGITLVSYSDLGIKGKKGQNKTLIAKEVGVELAKKAGTKKIKSVVFDRNGFKFHGRIKSLAEGAREGGLKF